PFNDRLPGLMPLGLFGGLEYGLGVNSRAAGSGERLATDVSSYTLGGAYRFGFFDEAFALEPEVAYTRSRFATGTEVAGFDASYDTLAPRLGWRFDVAPRVALFGNAAYLHVLSPGTLTDPERFPRATMYGGEASAGLSIAVGASLSLTASGGLRRFGIATNVVPGDAQIAGGAVDQTVWGALGVTYRPGAR
ncbi:MAG TPA: outer membrane beta-barrel protein, partial [Polyangia bacterium]